MAVMRPAQTTQKGAKLPLYTLHIIIFDSYFIA